MFLIYTLVFLGFFAGALVSPVLSPMFLHPQEHGVLPDSATVATRAFLLGLAMSMMRLGEFFGSPVLGQLSDHLGRKLVLAGALGITAIGNLAIGVAIQEEQVWIIVAGQFFIGFAGVLLVLAQSEIAANCEGSIKPSVLGTSISPAASPMCLPLYWEDISQIPSTFHSPPIHCRFMLRRVFVYFVSYGSY